ncbi:MAG TPA: hypothetical protein VMD06_06880 [Steroidobacteraceae bacterium]|nr:hypothetical protein [Steroidobacteraceae bacterium]
MANTLIHETRRLQFPLDTLVDALIELEDKQGHWPARATVVGASIDHSTTTDVDRVILSIHRPESGQVIERRYSLPMIAAAIVNYCLTLRVPMPRNSTKSIEVLPDSVVLLLENTVMLQSRHEELSTLPAGSVPTPDALPPETLPPDTPPSPASPTDTPAPPESSAPTPDTPPPASPSPTAAVDGGANDHTAS